MNCSQMDWYFCDIKSRKMCDITPGYDYVNVMKNASHRNIQNRVWCFRVRVGDATDDDRTDKMKVPRDGQELDRGC